MTVFKIVYVWGSAMSRTSPQDANKDVGSMLPSRRKKVIYNLISIVRSVLDITAREEIKPLADALKILNNLLKGNLESNS